MKFRELFPHLDDCNLVVWGTGGFYNRCRRIVDFDPVLFVDNNTAVQGQRLAGREIVHPGRLCELRMDNLVIVIMSTYESEIKFQIDGLGLDNVKTLVWSDIEQAIDHYVLQREVPSSEVVPQYTCDLCGHSTFSLLYTQAKHHRRHYVCEHCGFVFVYPRVTEQQHKDLCLNGLNGEHVYAKAERQALVRLRLLESVCPDLAVQGVSDRRVIEIGSGTGSFVHLMNLYGWDASGIEPDVDLAVASRERYNVDIMSEDEELPPNSADLVCSFHVIGHVSSPSEFLQHAGMLLKEDGYLYIECPGIERMNQSIDEFFWDDQINTFSEKVLRSFLAKAGFDWVKSGYNALGFLWVIGRKQPFEKPRITYETPQAVKNIVMRSHNPYNLNADKIAVKPESGSADYRIVHVGVHKNTNAGDTLLFPCVRQLFQQELGRVDFDLIDLRQPVTSHTIDRINQSNALVIGGGGLFLSDTNANPYSGWQWPIPVELLDQIRVPIIVFAVGYNRFRGQPDFAPVFTENVQKLVEKSAFFGLRNHGSLYALQRYLPERLWNKLTYQPCPTTILSKLQFAKLDRMEKKGKVLAVNVAMDRAGLRFGSRQKEIAERMAAALRELKADGWEIRLYHHHVLDEISSVWFRGQGIEVTEVDLNGAPPYDVLRYYADADVCMGMRGHAQMMPFGLGVPVLSLISHDKLGFFLEDIQRTEWGVEVHDSGLTKRMIQFAEESNLEQAREDIRQIQEQLWETTRHNMRLIRTAIDAAAVR